MNDDKIFNCVIRILNEVNNRILNSDPARATTWRKYVQSKQDNFDVKKPNIIRMTINWFRPLRNLLDGDYKQFVQITSMMRGNKVRRCTSTTLTDHL